MSKGESLLRNEDMANGKIGGSFRAVRWKPEKRHSKPYAGKYTKNWMPKSK